MEYLKQDVPCDYDAHPFPSAWHKFGSVAVSDMCLYWQQVQMSLFLTDGLSRIYGAHSSASLQAKTPATTRLLRNTPTSLPHLTFAVFQTSSSAQVRHLFIDGQQGSCRLERGVPKHRSLNTSRKGELCSCADVERSSTTSRHQFALSKMLRSRKENSTDA